MMTSLAAVQAQSEVLLRNTVKRFETVLSNLQGGILLVCNEGRMEYMNQALLDIFGLDRSPESFIGTRALDILPLLRPSFENPEASMQLIYDRITAGKPVRGEELRMTRGRMFLRDFIPIVLDGVVCGRLWFHQDITARKQSEEALQRSEQQLRMLIEAIPDAIFFKDGAGRMQVVNEPAKQLFQWTDCAWQGKTDLELGLENPEFQALHLACAIDDEKAWQARHLVVLTENPIAKNGRQLDFDVRKMPVFDAQGNRQALVIIGRDVTDANLAARELAQSTQQLKVLSQRVLTVQEAERRRIALELHDELGQSLTALKINLQRGQAFQTPEGAELHAQNLQIVSNALAQVRRLSLALRPSVLDDLGLVAALEWLADQMSTPNGLAVTLHTPLGEMKFSPELETAFFRVAQEALTNAARHAQARQVVMSLHLRGDELVLQVQDDGVGFDASACLARAKAGGSLGVLGMHERAMLLGGQLELDSRAGQGSTVRLICSRHAPEVLA